MGKWFEQSAAEVVQGQMQGVCTSAFITRGEEGCVPAAASSAAPLLAEHRTQDPSRHNSKPSKSLWKGDRAPGGIDAMHQVQPLSFPDTIGVAMLDSK
eukprot:scaffold1900_cov32-Tisochrysis_lutea.AAC.2